MAIDFTGINNKNEYYTNHYISTIFESSLEKKVEAWAKEAGDSGTRTPMSYLTETARSYNSSYERYNGGSEGTKMSAVCDMAERYLSSLGYGEPCPGTVRLDRGYDLPVYHEVNRTNGNPALWVLLVSTSVSSSDGDDESILEGKVFDAAPVGEGGGGALFYRNLLSLRTCEELVNEVFFGDVDEPPRFILLIGMKSMALLDRNKWGEKRYLEFDLEEIFSRRERSTLQVMSVLLHKTSLCPDAGAPVLDDFDEESRKNASGVSSNLKYSLRECIELLGNEVLDYMRAHPDAGLDADAVDAGELTLECLRYMYRMLFVFFIESRPELGYAPMKDQTYGASYSLGSLCDIVEGLKADSGEVGEGFYVHESISKLFDMIYNGYPQDKARQEQLTEDESIHDVFRIAPLKGHIFDPERTPMINSVKLRNGCMLKIIDRMSHVFDPFSKKTVRVSYSNLGINQLGSVYEALLSYRGFIAKEKLYEVKRAGDTINELDVGYFVTEGELDRYSEDERARYDNGDLRVYEKGRFIYRLAGREREKSASYYTPESLTKCLVKYALEELLKDKTADEILNLTICEPAMGSAAFINEAINQLAEAYIKKKEAETGETVRADERLNELQKVKMYIADRNVYGIDLNPVAVELAEVSIWLNSIYEGGYVPWFGTQLVNGNSLIGARRQVYKADCLKKNAATKWYDMEPERLPFDRERVDTQSDYTDTTEIYHFLLGDPGMCDYTDKVIKELCPENIKTIKAWNKRFTKPYDETDIKNLLQLSRSIDKLWKEHIKIRKQVEEKTRDSLSVFGHRDSETDTHTSIRAKDEILNRDYKSEEMRNAGPYARLKLAMDYWCALWFWPIDKADLLPEREDFLFEMLLILEGNNRNFEDNFQINLFSSEVTDQSAEFVEKYGLFGVVNIPQLRADYPRIDLVVQIAEKNKFMHWELEFADMFAERGGFDLIVGNPPWVKLEWTEKDVLSDVNPMFAIKNLTATEVTHYRSDVLSNFSNFRLYIDEYSSTSAQQNFLNSYQNYLVLKGQQTNLYKCFLPQGWAFTNNFGVTAYVHPDGVYDDPRGDVLRERIYPRIKKHFVFVNEKKLFADVDHHTVFGLNVYGHYGAVSFDTIYNLYDTSTIEECYNGDINTPIPKIKNNRGEWNTIGHPNRIIHIAEKELRFFAKLFDRNFEWEHTKMPVLYASQFLEILECFANQGNAFGDREDVFCTMMWSETTSQKDGTILRNIHFPESIRDTIYSGPHISVANPLFKTSRRVCEKNSDYDNVDLTAVGDKYIQRVNYSIGCDVATYSMKESSTPWGNKYPDNYRLCFRAMLNQEGEHTLIGAIIPTSTEHIHTVVGLCMKSNFVSFAANCFSLPYDFLLKIMGKDFISKSVLSSFPILEENPYQNSTNCRALLLNCLTIFYAPLWEDEYRKCFSEDGWSKKDDRLNDARFTDLSSEWNWNTPLRSDYERRQALVEIDVLTAMALEMTLEQLETIYNLSFPILQKNETNTWYDSNGRIVFTTNTSYSNVGFKRDEWETIKDAEPGKKFYRTITDDTMPGGPVERTIEYVAPFDRCDRIKDYETAWAFFEHKFKNQ